ncbi:hypothetical protein NL676_016134 [Syzygium grande]|nr:hypothetical protein NL676_016134 [Syzygium grande]
MVEACPARPASLASPSHSQSSPRVAADTIYSGVQPSARGALHRPETYGWPDPLPRSNDNPSASAEALQPPPHLQAASHLSSQASSSLVSSSTPPSQVEW